VAFGALLRPSQKAAIHPQAVVFQRLLSLPVADLRREIQREAEENPALDLAREWWERDGGEPHSPNGAGGQISGEAAEDGDGVPEVAARTSLQQHLWENFAAEASDSLTRRLGYYLIHNLDDDGYLCCSLEEAARSFSTGRGTVEAVLRLVQELEPPGVGARDLRECLLIQVRSLEGQGVHPLAEAILRDNWNAFARCRFDLVARSVGVSACQVREVAQFVRARLAPYPGRAYRLLWERPSVTSPCPATDVIVHRRNRGFDVEIPEAESSHLRVSPAYLEIHARMCSDGAGYSRQQRGHVIDSVRRARLFMSALDQRRRTLKKTAARIVSLEQRFFEQGAEGHLLLSRKALARELDFAPSTVSRALARKYLLTPAGDVLSFDIFFDPSVAAKQTIRTLVQNESKDEPLTDEEIAGYLSRRGIGCARRTVVKYREEMGILSRSKRGRMG